MTGNRSNRIAVQYTELGEIVAIVELSEQEEGPAAGVLPRPEIQTVELELSKSQLSIPLVTLHASSRIGIRGKQPRLISVKPPKKPKR
jgi:hypothetical protein